MKYFYYCLIIVFTGLTLYNLYSIDFAHPLAQVNYIPWISVLSAISGLILTMIMLKVISVKKEKAKF